MGSRPYHVRTTGRRRGVHRPGEETLRAGAVSYTHLDVYKRQAFQKTRLGVAALEFAHVVHRIHIRYNHVVKLLYGVTFRCLRN